MRKWGELTFGNHSSVFERFTNASHRAIDFAWKETMRRGGSEISVADLLAGLSFDEDSRAERVGSLKANAFYLRWLVALPALPAIEVHAIADLQTKVIDESLALDVEANRALAYAVLEADRDRNYWIDSDHLLRGILRFPNKAHFAMLKVEVNLDSARTASRKDRWEFAPAETPSGKVVTYLIRKYTVLIVPPALGLACYLYILFQGIGTTLSPITR